MPKEQINYPTPFEPRCSCGDNEGCTNCAPAIHGEAWPEPELGVSWSKASDFGAGHVQISLRLPARYLKHLVASLDGADASDSDTVTAFSPALDRGELNKLIRTARLARDQAHGRDE